jgi:hypothetical protein
LLLPLGRLFLLKKTCDGGRYASLFFIVGCLGKTQNELETLEFIHCLVETLDRYFERSAERVVFAGGGWACLAPYIPTPSFSFFSPAPRRAYANRPFPSSVALIVSLLTANSVCELDIMFNLEKAHMILDEMVRRARIDELFVPSPTPRLPRPPPPTPSLLPSCVPSFVTFPPPCVCTPDPAPTLQVANGVVYDANKATALATVALVEKVGKE